MTELSNARIAFVGGGLMAEAIMRGLLSHQVCPAGAIVAADPVSARRDYLSANIGVAAVAENTAAVAGADVVILAVKPQMLATVMAGLKGQVPAGAMVLSIVAGATIDTLRQGLGAEAIVRVMPNTPAQVGEGMIVWTVTPAVTATQQDQARQILASLGVEMFVEDEHYVDLATGISGSGPAYVFLFIEALVDAGVQLGFPRPVAQKLAIQTVKGSAIFAEQSGQHPAVLRNMVTSPGGTTAVALYYLEKGGLRSTVSRAVAACYEKSLELAEMSKK
jgi:pyrroline-5-carboxylate reductase